MLRRVRFSLCVFLFSWSAWAQVPTAEITGTVTDATSAVVSGATVTITNLATNAQRVIATNSAGVYDAPSLAPGAYSVKVAMAGFKTEVRSNIEVQVDQVARLDFTLAVGNLSETVEVAEAAPALQTETTSLGTVIENKRIVELPLNGRNYLQLASLVPGSTTYGPVSSVGQQRMGGSRNDFSLNVAGARLEFNHYSLDGIENTDPNFSTYLFQPSIDALQEFKVETGTYSAEYGHGLGQVNVITRSGTNEYHGSLFEFLRNSDLDAKNFFDSPRNPIPPFKRNQFGGTLGGPVDIPKVVNGRDKLFFFFDYEGLRQRKAQTALSTLPFASDRAGDFSASSAVLYDPATRVTGADGKVTASRFLNNVIPSSRISPVSAFAFQNFFPQPNRSTGGFSNNFLSNEGARADSDQELARVDWAAGANSSFQFRYSHGNEPLYNPSPIPLQGSSNTTITHQAVLGHTWVLGANKVNEFKFGVSRLESYNSLLHTNDPQFDYVGKLGISGLTDIPLFYGSPFLQISNFTSVGDPANGPYLNFDTVIQWTDNFSWNKGKHSFKFGADIRRTRFNLMGNDVARGRFSFSGQYTVLPGSSPAPQNSIADFLLGLMSRSEGQTGLVVANLRNYSMGYYFQDQWKVTPHLTVNYGLRYELEPGYHDKYNRMMALDFRWDNSMVPTFVRAGTGDPYQGNPPFPLPSTIPVVRDGRFGNTMFKTDYHNFGPRLGVAYSPNSKTVIRSGFGIYYVHDIGNALFDSMRNPPFTLRRSEAANTLFPNLSWSVPFTVVGAPTLTPVFQWAEPTSYVPQWSLSVQRELGRDTSLEVAYLGSAGVHLERTVYYNAAPPGPPGDFNPRRPYPILGDVQLVNRPSHASYDALQLRLQRRFSRGFTVLSSFTYGKSIDNGSGVRPAGSDAYIPSDNTNLAGERGLSAFDFHRRWTTSFLYELPFGKGKPLLGGASPLANAFLGGWQLGGIFTLQDGFPFSIGCSNNAAFQNNSAACRADAVGIDPALPGGERGPSRWFNTAAFVDRIGFTPGVGPYRVGNSGRNNVIGPGITELDFSMAKSFRLAERANLEFRSEFFNLPNHPIFGLPGATVKSPTFGVIGSTRLDSRQIQFGLRLSF